MTLLTKDNYKLEWFAAGELSVLWVQAQRPFREHWAKALAATFNPVLFEPPLVTQPDKKGIRHTIDGQHRVAAIRLRGGNTALLPCRVAPTVDPEEADAMKKAAALFVEANTHRSSPTFMEGFTTNVTAGKAREVAIHNAMLAVGYTATRASNGIRALSILTRAYDRHGIEVVAAMLKVLRKAWPNEQTATEGPIMEGVTDFIGQFRGLIDMKRLVNVLAKTIPSDILINAKSRRAHAIGGSVRMGVVVRDIIYQLYNYRLNSSHLPPLKD